MPLSKIYNNMLIIKVGGGKTINWNYIAVDLKKIIKHEEVVIVHGANAIRDELALKLGHPTKTITSPSGMSSVYTDKESIDIFLMSYAGLVNKKIVALLQKNGSNAVGLSGIDGKLWEGKRKEHVLSVENGKTKLIKDNLTGRIETINTELIGLLLKNNYTPVVCPPAITNKGEIINTDGDLATVQMAKSLNAKKIIFLFESPGLLKKYPDEKTVIKKIDKNKIDEYISFAEGRMKKKMLAVKKAFEFGVNAIYFGDGRIKNPITNCLKGSGTTIQ